MGSIWADLGTSLLRSLFGELGDKTFFLTLVLAAWCPWEGPREYDHSALQRLLVVLGAMVALFAHIVVIAEISDAEWEEWCHESWIFEVFSGLLLALLALRAYLGKVEPSVALPAGDAAKGCEGDPLAAKPTEQQYNQHAFAFPSLPTAEHESYGAAEPMTADGLLSQNPSSKTWSSIFAFVVTLACAFPLEAEDKSWYAYVEGGRAGADSATGAIFGRIPALMVAAFAGYFMVCQLEAATIRGMTVFAFLSLSLISFSQAVLHWNILEPSPADAAATTAAEGPGGHDGPALLSVLLSGQHA